jgi:hypothetical protein
MIYRLGSVCSGCALSRQPPTGSTRIGSPRTTSASPWPTARRCTPPPPARLDELGVAHGGVKDLGRVLLLEFRDPHGIALELRLTNCSDPRFLGVRG